MSLAVTCWWTMVRTVVLCLLAWPLCHIVERFLRNLTDARQSWGLACLLAPACFPELLVGYSYRDLALAHPDWAEILCSALLFARIVPVGTIALLAAPRSDPDAAGIYCQKLLVDGLPPWSVQRIELLRCYWYGPVRRAVPALLLMSLVAFQEFEMAALLQTISWTDWFMSAQRLGLERTEMMWQVSWPLLWQLPLLIGVLHWLQSSRGDRAASTSDLVDESSASRRRWYWVGLFAIAALLTVGCLIPLMLIGWRTLDGFGLLLRQRNQQAGLLREMVISSAVALSAGLFAWGISSRLRGITAIGMALGLLGSLLLSLASVSLFQNTWLRPLYDTPLPWVLTLTVWLLPRAAILRLWLRARANSEALHVARLMVRGDERRRLLWRLDDQPRFLAASLLCYWAYCDLPTAHLLAPTGLASGLVRLYNFMHFGRSAALSAEACVFFGTPVLLVSLLITFLRWWRF